LRGREFERGGLEKDCERKRAEEGESRKGRGREAQGQGVSTSTSCAPLLGAAAPGQTMSQAHPSAS